MDKDEIGWPIRGARNPQRHPREKGFFEDEANIALRNAAAFWLLPMIWLFAGLIVGGVVHGLSLVLVAIGLTFMSMGMLAWLRRWIRSQWQRW